MARKKRRLTRDYIYRKWKDGLPMTKKEWAAAKRHNFVIGRRDRYNREARALLYEERHEERGDYRPRRRKKKSSPRHIHF